MKYKLQQFLNSPFPAIVLSLMHMIVLLWLQNTKAMRLSLSQFLQFAFQDLFSIEHLSTFSTFSFSISFGLIFWLTNKIIKGYWVVQLIYFFLGLLLVLPVINYEGVERFL